MVLNTLFTFVETGLHITLGPSELVAWWSLGGQDSTCTRVWGYVTISSSVGLEPVNLGRVFLPQSDALGSTSSNLYLHMEENGSVSAVFW